MLETTAHTHFLTYKQTGEFDYPLGETDLFYSLVGNQLSVVSKSRAGGFFAPKTEEYHTELPQVPSDTKATLTEFLTVYLSKLGYGHPWYVKSELFTNQEFSTILTDAINLINERKAKAKLNTSILTEVCEKYKLRPEPCNGSGTSWQADCPSGRGHWIAISTETNTWGCGYCRRKGGIPELVEWMEEIRAAKSFN